MQAVYTHLLQLDGLSPAALFSEQAGAAVEAWIGAEKDDLIARLRPKMDTSPEAMLGTINSLPLERAVNPLQKHLSARV